MVFLEDLDAWIGWVFSQAVVWSTSPASIRQVFPFACPIRVQIFGHVLLIRMHPIACCSPKIHHEERSVAFLQHWFEADPDFSALRCFICVKSVQKLSFVQRTLLLPRFFEAEFPKLLSNCNWFPRCISPPSVQNYRRRLRYRCQVASEEKAAQARDQPLLRSKCGG